MERNDCAISEMLRDPIVLTVARVGVAVRTSIHHRFSGLRLFILLLRLQANARTLAERIDSSLQICSYTSSRGYSYLIKYCIICAKKNIVDQ